MTEMTMSERFREHMDEVNRGQAWVTVLREDDTETRRLTVPGGWLYAVIDRGTFGARLHTNVVFVPTAPPLNRQG